MEMIIEQSCTLQESRNSCNQCISSTADEVTSYSPATAKAVVVEEEDVVMVVAVVEVVVGVAHVVVVEVVGVDNNTGVQ